VGVENGFFHTFREGQSGGEKTRLYEGILKWFLV